MDPKPSKVSLVLAFDPSGSPEQLHFSLLDSNTISPTDTSDSSSEASHSSSEVSYHVTQINDLPSWLNLRTEAIRDLKHLEIDVSHDTTANSTSNSTEYYQMSQKKYRQLLSAAKARGIRNSIATELTNSRSQRNLPTIVLYHIGVDKTPRITWAVFFCSQILNSKLAMIAKIEHSKAVASTLGGAYATLQRSGWAKHYARQQLAIARLTGDEQLALRAHVYLEICKIISIIFPKYAARKVYQDGENHVTTRTDTNATVEDARAISAAKRLQLEEELEELMKEAKKSESEEIVGLVKYAKHRVNNAPTKP